MNIETATVLVAGVSVVIAAINSIISSRRAEEQRQLTLEAQQQALETRQAQLFMQIYDWWRSREGVKAYGSYRYNYVEVVHELGYPKFFEQLQEQWRAGDMESYADQMTLMAFLEGVGVLVNKGLVDIELEEDLLSQRIIWIWEQAS